MHNYPLAVEFEQSSAVRCKPQSVVPVFEHCRYAEGRGGRLPLVKRIASQRVRLPVKHSQRVAGEVKDPECPEYTESILVKRKRPISNLQATEYGTQLAGTDPEAKPLDESESSFGLLRRLSFRWLAAEKVQPDANALMQAEPLIRRGLRQFDLRPWELREGRMTIVLNASTSSFRLDSPDLTQV